MQNWLKQEELKEISVPFLCAMGKQVTMLFALCRSLCFLLYLLMHNTCRDKLQSDTLVFPHQVRPKELGCNPILYTLLVRTDLQWQIPLGVNVS